MQKLFILLFIVLISGCGSDSNGTIKSVQTSPPAPLNGLVKEVVVFGISVKATSSVSDEKLRHAAGVMAQYLDNDEDGLPDNEAVVARMVEEEAVLLMVGTEEEMNTLFTGGNEAPQNGQDLYASETHPEGSKTGSFDASLEEVLHLITHVGYANVYPDVFGESSGSAVADAMDKARGGYFEAIPSVYPSGAWYTYDDDTCDYGCQVTEYTYWAFTSILGGQSFNGRLEEIRHEWQLNTRAKVETDDPDVYDILTGAEYKLPTVLPDGDYNGAELVITQLAGSTAGGATSSGNGQSDLADASLGIETVPASMGQEYTDNFNRYTAIPVPNGKAIHIMAQSRITNEQIIRARNVLQHYLTDLPGSLYGADKSDVANTMADNNAVLLLLNGSDDGSNPIEVDGQPLYEAEIQVEGHSWYINQDYENHRDATFEEILHLVHDYGIGVDGSNALPGAFPDFQSEIRAAQENALTNNLWGIGAADWITELTAENSLSQEYLASVIDSYYGLWGAWDESDTHGMMGLYVVKERTEIATEDPEGAKLMNNRFFHPYLTYNARIDAGFEGTFTMCFDDTVSYTHHAQYLKDITLTGDNDVSVKINGYDNVIIGNTGTNIIIFSGESAEYTVNEIDTEVIVTDHITERDGINKLYNVEFLEFTDKTIVLTDD